MAPVCTIKNPVFGYGVSGLTVIVEKCVQNLDDQSAGIKIHLIHLLCSEAIELIINRGINNVSTEFNNKINPLQGI